MCLISVTQTWTGNVASRLAKRSARLLQVPSGRPRHFAPSGLAEEGVECLKSPEPPWGLIDVEAYECPCSPSVNVRGF